MLATDATWVERALEGTESRCFNQHSSAELQSAMPLTLRLALVATLPLALARSGAAAIITTVRHRLRAEAAPCKETTKRAEGASHEAIRWGRQSRPAMDR